MEDEEDALFDNLTIPDICENCGDVSILYFVVKHGMSVCLSCQEFLEERFG